MLPWDSIEPVNTCRVLGQSPSRRTGSSREEPDKCISGFHRRERKERYVVKESQVKGEREECTAENTDTFEKVAERREPGHCLEEEQSRQRAQENPQAREACWAPGRKSGWPAGLDGGTGKEREEVRSGVEANSGLSEQREGRCSQCDEKLQGIWGKKATLGGEGGRQEWQGLGEDATRASTQDWGSLDLLGQIRRSGQIWDPVWADWIYWRIVCEVREQARDQAASYFSVVCLSWSEPQEEWMVVSLGWRSGQEGVKMGVETRLCHAGLRVPVGTAVEIWAGSWLFQSRFGGEAGQEPSHQGVMSIRWYLKPWNWWDHRMVSEKAQGCSPEILPTGMGGVGRTTRQRRQKNKSEAQRTSE